MPPDAIEISPFLRYRLHITSWARLLKMMVNIYIPKRCKNDTRKTRPAGSIISTLRDLRRRPRWATFFHDMRCQPDDLRSILQHLNLQYLATPEYLYRAKIKQDRPNLCLSNSVLLSRIVRFTKGGWHQMESWSDSDISNTNNHTSKDSTRNELTNFHVENIFGRHHFRALWTLYTNRWYGYGPQNNVLAVAAHIPQYAWDTYLKNPKNISNHVPLYKIKESCMWRKTYSKRLR